MTKTFHFKNGTQFCKFSQDRLSPSPPGSKVCVSVESRVGRAVCLTRHPPVVRCSFSRETSTPRTCHLFTFTAARPHSSEQTDRWPLDNCCQLEHVQCFVMSMTCIVAVVKAFLGNSSRVWGCEVRGEQGMPFSPGNQANYPQVVCALSGPRGEKTLRYHVLCFCQNFSVMTGW